MAVLWDSSTKEDRIVIESCAVITLRANEVMNVIQNTAGTNEGRMPAILHPADQEAWLRGTPEQAFACLAPYEDELTIGRNVSAWVISPKSLLLRGSKPPSSATPCLPARAVEAEVRDWLSPLFR